MKKGQTAVPIAFALLVIIGIIIGTAGGLFGQKMDAGIGHVIKTDDAYTIHNSIICGINFLKNALDYSFFQAINDAESIKMDSADGKKISETLEPLIDENMNKYTLSGSRKIYCIGKGILLPLYDSIKMKRSGNFTEVSAKADKNILFSESYSVDDHYIEEADADIVRKYEINPFEMMDYARELYNKLKLNGCVARVSEGDCAEYYCSATSSHSNKICTTTIVVTYRKMKYPVMEKVSEMKRFKLLSLSFLFKESDKTP